MSTAEAFRKSYRQYTGNSRRSVTSIYAGGYQAPVDGTANLTISGGSVGNNNSIFGGGNEAGATAVIQMLYFPVELLMPGSLAVVMRA